jgi:hypothetical protein
MKVSKQIFNLSESILNRFDAERLKKYDLNKINQNNNPTKPEDKW